MAGLSSSGFESKPLVDIESDIASRIRSGISPTLNLSSTSVIGQWIGSGASQLSQLWEALQALYASMDIDQAEGDRLGALTRLTGTTRRGATYSTATLDVTLAAGTYGAGALVVHVVGDSTARFANVASVTSPGGVVSGVLFEAEDAGPVRANSGTLTVIANPVVGFTAATNPTDALVGSPQETDPELRKRHEDELARRGSSTVDAIRADLLEVDGVTFVQVYENDTDATDGEGRPPHSFEAVVLGGLTIDVLDAVWAAKPAGIRAYGTTSGTAVDSQGFSHIVGFSRPDDVLLYLNIQITAQQGRFVGSTAVVDAVLDYAAENIGPGKDVIHSRLVSVVMEQDGVIDASVTIGTSPLPVSTSNYVITPRQLARLDSSRINIGVSLVNGAP